MRRTILLAAFLAPVVFAGCSTHPAVFLPGVRSDGTTLLPNGWTLSPAGTHVAVGDFPMNMAISPDGRFIAVLNSGAGSQSISIIDTVSWRLASTTPVAKCWLGLKWAAGGRELIVSGGNDNRVLIYDVSDGRPTLSDSVVLGAPWPKEKLWVSGLDVDDFTQKLYICTRYNDCLYSVDLSTKKILARNPLPARPYTCLLSRDRGLLFVSLWGGAQVALIDPGTLTILHLVPVGSHPNDMVESPDGRRLYVANANDNTVSVIDIHRAVVTETLSSALLPDLPPGSTPNAVALNADGTRLAIANADNNYVALMDVSREGKTTSLGFIPVGWYPTCVRVHPGSNEIIVANGKGASSKPNPRGPNPERRSAAGEEYIGHLFTGTLSRIAQPSAQELSLYSAKVYANTPVTTTRYARTRHTGPNPVPRAVTDVSPIKHVFYIIKENRTYDQVFGDLPEGNGDSSLCLFPDRITPNHHALARQFALLDNFYCDAEVSADGHNWSMGAYANDYVEKSWPTSYGGRGGDYEFGGGFPIAYPSRGFLWDNCRRSGVSYRIYGEFTTNGPTPDDSTSGTMESMRDHVAPFYRGWDLSYSDVLRAEAWAEEFDRFERERNLPSCQIISLPNDHTEGTRKGSLAPRAFVAQNDLALGMIVERISRSPYWKESAIFVIEDDAQNGPDHVDAHRTVALVISPYTKHHFVDNELYSSTSMVRTIELILGLPPLSQFDAAAQPMYNSFTTTPDFSPYVSHPANVDIHEKNPSGAYGQQRSEQLDFTRVDAIPDTELNEIIWKSIHGAGSAMPPPVRSAFVHVRDQDPDHNDD